MAQANIDSGKNMLLLNLYKGHSLEPIYKGGVQKSSILKSSAYKGSNKKGSS